MEVVTYNASETEELGAALSKQIPRGLVLLTGPLGSGKTTFVRGFVRGRGVNTPVQSPTFQLHRQYGPVHHFDLYRLSDAVNPKELGIAELLTDPNATILIEWAEKLTFGDGEYVEVAFTMREGSERRISIAKQRENGVDHQHVTEAVRILRDGGVVVYPTDTVYGIGCRFDLQKSVERVFAVKNRPWTLPVPLLVGSKEQLMYVAESVPAAALVLMEKHWPGALTIVLPAQTDRIAPLVLAGGNTVGVRRPNHPTTLALLSELQLPIVGTSANVHDRPPVAEKEGLDPKVMSQVDYVLYGKPGAGVESTIVNCTRQPPCIVRRGAVETPEIAVCSP